MGKGYSIDVVKKKSVSPVCRGSYVNILEPRTLPDSEKMAWGMQCLFPKSDPAVVEWMKEIKGVFAQVLIDKFGKDKAVKMASSIKIPIRDGDAPAEADKELQGYWFMNPNNVFRQPHIIGVDGKPIPDTAALTVDDIYSGAWYRVMLEFWYYDKAGNKGISSSIAAIMKVKDDENLGSGTSKKEAGEAFGDFADEAASMFTTEDEGSPEEQSKKEADEFDFL